MGVGGEAELLLEPADPDELRAAVCAAREAGHEPFVLGGGANLLVADGAIPGIVISTERMRRTFRPLPPGVAPEGEEFADELPRELVLEKSEDPRLVAWAGATLPGLVRAASQLGWAGLEGLVGVPGSLGGGVAMNAGGAPGCMWDVVESVRVLNAAGEFEDRPRAECDPQYRNANLGGAVVVGAVLRLSVDSRPAVEERTREFLLRKRAVQPVTEKSAGCIFKNPDPELSDGRSAGQLIDQLGGKGLSRGAAVVSPKHANYLVNQGGARAEDAIGLIGDLWERVREGAGVELELEVKQLGWAFRGPEAAGGSQD